MFLELLGGLVVVSVIVWFVIKNNRPEWADKIKAEAKTVADVNKDGKVDIADAKVVEKNTVAEVKRAATKVKKITTKKKKN